MIQNHPSIRRLLRAILDLCLAMAENRVINLKIKLQLHDIKTQEQS